MREKRKHDRYPASEMTFVVGLESPGLITDVSDGGLGIRYKGSEELPDELVLDLLNAPKSVVIDRIRCRKVRDETVSKVAVFSYISERRIGLEFLEPNAQQIDALDLFKGAQN
ncbi:MAG: PilZ domain-containing protein [Pseudomonadota bacterium]